MNENEHTETLKEIVKTYEEIERLEAENEMDEEEDEEEYEVTFTQTAVVWATSKEEAVEKAFSVVNLDDPYIYVDGDPVN